MPAKVDYPDFFKLPPFFTLQPNLATREKQAQMWTQLLTSYCSSTEKYELNITEPVFENKDINRKVQSELYDFLVSYMEKNHKADKLPGNGLRFYVYSKRELAEMLWQYIDSNGKAGSVETVFSFYAGEECEREKFYGLPKECVLGALKLLEQEGKCELFGADDVDNAGVKFFA